jgi:hypothetical protein
VRPQTVPEAAGIVVVSELPQPIEALAPLAVEAPVTVAPAPRATAFGPAASTTGLIRSINESAATTLAAVELPAEVAPAGDPAAPLPVQIAQDTQSTATTTSRSGGHDRFDWPDASPIAAFVALMALGYLLLLAVTEASPRNWQFRPLLTPS